MRWLVTKGDLRNICLPSTIQWKLRAAEERRVCRWEINTVNEWLQFAPRMKEKRNKMKQKSSKDFVTARRISEIKSAAVSFLNRVQERGSFLNCRAPSRNPELIHLDTESENIPTPFYTQATADKPQEQCAFMLRTPNLRLYQYCVLMTWNPLGLWWLCFQRCFRGLCVSQIHRFFFLPSI